LLRHWARVWALGCFTAARRRPTRTDSSSSVVKSHEPVSALVISEICFFREGIVAALEDAPEIGAVTGAAQAPQPEDGARVPDVVVVDLSTTQSLSVIAAVRRAAPHARIVALGADREEQALACARASVRGFVTRDQSLDELVSTVVEVARGRELCPPSVGVLLLRVMGGDAPDRGNALTNRELDVLKLLERGLSNKEIAAALVIEPATAKNHVHNVLRKLNVHRRGQAAALGRRLEIG
jgi:DNA-binding NarL/FixJ family response regulator